MQVGGFNPPGLRGAFRGVVKGKLKRFRCPSCRMWPPWYGETAVMVLVSYKMATAV